MRNPYEEAQNIGATQQAGSNLTSELGGIGGALGGLLGGMFGGGQSPMDAYNQYASGIPGTLEQYLSPYTQMGQQMIPQMQGLYGGLVSDPTKVMSQIGSQYQQSPGYQYEMGQAMNAANQAAAAGGMAGTPAAQQQAQQTAQGLASQDYQNFMNQGLNLYGQGLTGLQGLETQGFQGAQSLAQALAQAQQAQAMMAAAQAQQKQNESSGFLGGIGSIAGSLISKIPGL
ncbi:MAG: hypothetical protein JSW00_04080 [Thermoplasmata archaeon]|nr:MAG: hypothetical protein JSW00_04080 [Thermoplasmata archaeon]